MVNLRSNAGVISHKNGVSCTQRDDEELSGEAGADQIRVEDVEALVRGIAAVTECHIVVNDWGGVEEVHVLATMARPAKAIVRDIESMLAARFGLIVDHKKISVAQISEDGAREKTIRFIIQSHNLTISRVQNWASVTVGLGSAGDIETRFVGRSEGSFFRRHVWKMAASATIDAVQQALADGPCFSADDVTIMEHGGHQVAVVTVALLLGRAKEEALVGSALHRGDDILTVARATLDALNRRIDSLPRRAVKSKSGS